MANDLSRILDTLALIRLRRSLGSDVGGKLTDLLLVNAMDDHLVGSRNLDGDAVDFFHGHKVGSQGS